MRTVNPQVCDQTTCSLCGGTCMDVVITVQGTDYVVKRCVSKDGKDRGPSCMTTPPKPPQPSRQPQRQPLRQPQRTGRPMYHPTQIARSVNPPSAPSAVQTRLKRRGRAAVAGGGVQRSLGCTICESCGGTCIVDPFSGNLSCPGGSKGCVQAGIDLVRDAAQPGVPAVGDPTVGMPSKVLRRLERRGRTRISAPQAAGPNEPPTTCKEHCDKYYIWPYWEACMERCKAKGSFTTKPKPGEPAMPCPPGWVMCPDGTCAPSASECGLTAPPPPAAAPSGIRRAQAAMGGRLSNPRQGR